MNSSEQLNLILKPWTKTFINKTSTLKSFSIKLLTFYFTTKVLTT